LNLDDIVVDEQGRLHLFVNTNSLITLSTISNATKGSYPIPPASSRFPIPYRESFEQITGFSEASNFADQAGAFEIFHNASSQSDHDWTFRQVRDCA